MADEEGNRNGFILQNLGTGGATSASQLRGSQTAGLGRLRAAAGICCRLSCSFSQWPPDQRRVQKHLSSGVGVLPWRNPSHTYLVHGISWEYPGAMAHGWKHAGDDDSFKRPVQNFKCIYLFVSHVFLLPTNHQWRGRRCRPRRTHSVCPIRVPSARQIWFLICMHQQLVFFCPS